MRVARIITRLNIGGPSIQAMTLSERLAPRGFETLLIHGRLGAGEGDMQYLMAGAGIDAKFVPALQRPVNPVQDALALAELYRVLCRFRPAIVHTHMAKAGTLGRTAAALYNRTAGRRAPARIVHTYHGHVLEGYFDSTSARLFTWTERRLAATTDAIVAISPQIRSELLEQYGIGRAGQYRVVRLGFDLRALAAIDDCARREARATLGLHLDARVVTTVGRLTAIKQHALFVETAALIAARDSAAVFLVAGDGELRGALEGLVRERGLESRVRFLGWRRDLATVYGASDVFLLTSRNEGTPVALIESLAAGVPGVSTDVGGVRDVIDTDAVGLLAPAGAAPALADHVVALLGDRARRLKMGEAGRESVVGRYGIERLVGDIDALYQELLH
jgi:glycosyltransferase involved in cell wall biosynthesis